MAEQPATTPAEALARPSLANYVNELKRVLRQSDAVVTEEDVHGDEPFTYEALTTVIATALNGRKDVQEQKVTVSYLSRDQLLVIPAALGMNPFSDNPDDSESLLDPLIATRYLKVGTMTFAQIAQLFTAQSTSATRRAAVDALEIDNARTSASLMRWSDEDFGRDAQGLEVPPDTVAYYFALLSRSLQINCDIRDVGKLVMPEFQMRVADSEWARINEVPPGRLRSKLEAYSLDCIAGLNMSPCNNCKLGSWVRAFGVGCGVLPNRTTGLKKEWRFVKAPPSSTIMRDIATVHNQLGDQLMTFSLNVLAMFGLFHLNKNHTYKTGDDNMERVCNSYIMTLRTMVENEVVEEMKSHREVMCRTAAHPFGLGQTYWLARVLHSIGAMPSPLMKRIDVCPPLVQRLLVTEAACREWTTVPVGATFNTLFRDLLVVIQNEIRRIRETPPAFSELHRLYGIGSMLHVDEMALAHANTLMPLISGYAAAMHTDENNVKDGLALALSFQNIEKDHRVATKSYQTLWEKYVDTLDEEGLEEFVKKSLKLAETVNVAENVLP